MPIDLLQQINSESKPTGSIDLVKAMATPSQSLATSTTKGVGGDIGNAYRKVTGITKDILNNVQDPIGNDVLHPTILDPAHIKKQQELDDAKIQATYTGILSFAGSLANVVTKGQTNTIGKILNPLGAIVKPQLKTADTAISNYIRPQNEKFQQNLGKYGQQLQVPYMAGQGVASLPLNGLFRAGAAATKAIGSIPTTGMVSSALVKGAQYGTGAATGMGAGAAFGGMTYDPDNPDMFNAKLAKEYGLSPYSAGLGLLGSGVGGYAAQTQKLMEQEKKGFGAIALNRDTKPAVKTILDNTMGELPLIGDASRRYAQQQSFIPGTQKFIKTMAATIGAKTTTGRLSNGKESLDQAVQSALFSAKNRIAQDEKAIWAPINNVQNKIKLGGENVQTIKQNVRQFIQEHHDDLETNNKGLLSYLNNKVLESTNPHPTFAELKLLKSTIQKYVENPRTGLQQPTQEAAHDLIHSLYNGLDDAIYKTDPKLVPAYHEATAFTAAKYSMFKDAGISFNKAYKSQALRDLEGAVKSNAEAYQFAQKLITEPSPTKVTNMLYPFTETEANQIRGGIINKHLKDSIDPVTNSFNISEFLNKTSMEKNSNVVMGSSYKALQGLQEVMKPVALALDEAAKPTGAASHIRQGIAYGALAGAGAAAVYAPGTTAAVVASTAALAAISHYSPLKRLLIAATRVSNNPELLKVISDRAHQTIQKAGLIIGTTPDGKINLKSKEEQ